MRFSFTGGQIQVTSENKKEMHFLVDIIKESEKEEKQERKHKKHVFMKMCDVEGCLRFFRGNHGVAIHKSREHGLTKSPIHMTHDVGIGKMAQVV